MAEYKWNIGAYQGDAAGTDYKWNIGADQTDEPEEEEEEGVLMPIGALRLLQGN